MGFIEYLLIAVILCAASYHLYRSFYKGNCHCDGCSISSCSGQIDKERDDKEFSWDNKFM